MKNGDAIYKVRAKEIHSGVNITPRGRDIKGKSRLARVQTIHGQCITIPVVYPLYALAVVGVAPGKNVVGTVGIAMEVVIPNPAVS